MNKGNFESIITEIRSNMKELSGENVKEIATECGNTVLAVVIDEKNNEAECAYVGLTNGVMTALSLATGLALSAMLDSEVGLEQAKILIHRVAEIGIQEYLDRQNIGTEAEKSKVVEFKPNIEV